MSLNVKKIQYSMINKQDLRSNIQKTNSIWCSTSVKTIQSITSTPSMHF